MTGYQHPFWDLTISITHMNSLSKILNTTSVFIVKQGNSVARDLPPTGSEANTTIFYIHVCIGYRFPLSLST